MNRNRFPWLLSFLSVMFLLALVHVAMATVAEVRGRVVTITDGDTLTILERDKRQTKIRLAEIDTPEKRQPYGTKSKEVLSNLVFGKDVRVVVHNVDGFGRMVGRVYVMDIDVNAVMVRLGAAWVYQQYSRDPGLLELQHEARLERRGLWALPETDRMPPWEWRAAKRAERYRTQ